MAWLESKEEQAEKAMRIVIKNSDFINQKANVYKVSAYTAGPYQKSKK